MRDKRCRAGAMLSSASACSRGKSDKDRALRWITGGIPPLFVSDLHVISTWRRSLACLLLLLLLHCSVPCLLLGYILLLLLGCLLPLLLGLLC